MEIKIEIEELRKRGLFVATPMYGGNCHGMYSKSMADLSALCRGYGIPLQIYYLFNESLITRARNYCADEFFRSGASHLMFIDSDIGFNPNDVIALLAMAGDDSPYDVIGGPYPKKCISWEKVYQAVNKGFADKNPNELERFVGDYVFNPKANTKHIQINEPTEVLEIGTGFMMIKRRTFEVLNQKYPEMLYTPDHVRTEHFDGSRQIMAYFQDPIDNTDFGKIYKSTLEELKGLLTSDKPVDNKTTLAIIQHALDAQNERSNRLLSEDYFFCQKAQEAGLKVWLCPWMKMQHVGTYIFGGSLADLAVLGASATADGEMLKKQRGKK